MSNASGWAESEAIEDVAIRVRMTTSGAAFRKVLFLSQACAEYLILYRIMLVN
jgi:hypothetical protein